MLSETVAYQRSLRSSLQETLENSAFYPQVRLGATPLADDVSYDSGREMPMHSSYSTPTGCRVWASGLIAEAVTGRRLFCSDSGDNSAQYLLSIDRICRSCVPRTYGGSARCCRCELATLVSPEGCVHVFIMESKEDATPIQASAAASRGCAISVCFPAYSKSRGR